MKRRTPSRGAMPDRPITPIMAAARAEAERARHGYIGVEHLTLALVGMDAGAVPPILSALGTTQSALRAAILDRYRQAS